VEDRLSEVTKTDLQALLDHHIGAKNGISAQAVAEQLGCNKRHVRDLVTVLRMESIAVCGHPKTGYFIAASKEELEQTCQFLRDRAMTSLQLEAKLRGLPLADLVGQMKLPT
jgi:predicted transcriptional regulator